MSNAEAVWFLVGYAVALFGVPVAVGYLVLWNARRKMRNRLREMEAVLLNRFNGLAETIRREGTG